MEGQSLRSIIGIDFNSLTFEGSSYPLAENTIGKYVNENVYIDEGFCFTGQTHVWQGGKKYTEIATLKEGDFVNSYNHKQKATMRNKIKRLFKRSVDSLTKIVIGGATVLCTPGHNIYANDSYIRAADLSPRDSIYTSSGNYERIDEVSTFDTTATVYNIEVEGNHNYFVSDHNLLVHNNCGWLTLKNTEDLSQSTFNQFTNNLINIGSEVTVAQRKHFYDAINTLTPAQRSAFLNDFGDNAEALTDFISDLGLVDAWKRIFGIFPANSKFITDIPTLERVSKLASEGSAFRTKLGYNWSEALDDILKNTNDLKCSSCGNAGRVGRSSMDQYLDDVDHFVSNFTVTSGGKGETFFNWMRNTTNPTSGQLDELHQTIRDFAKRGIKESEVEGLGKQFPVGTKRYDLRRVGDKYTEYKNKDFVGSPLTAGSDDVDQFINGYLKNVKSMDDLEWKAGFDKLKSAWGSEANALTKMKGQWKSVFQNKADDIFDVIWENENLRNSLFGNLASSQTNSRALFNTLVQNTDDKIFKFVIVE